MRWAKAHSALILLAVCLLVLALTLLQGQAGRVVPSKGYDRTSGSLPPLALVRLGGKGKPIDPHAVSLRPINSAYFTPDGRSLVLAGEDGSLRVRDWATGCERHCWRSAGSGKFDSPLPICLSSDGRLLAQAIDNRTIRLREIQTNKEVRTFHTAGEIWFLDFSPDDELLICWELGREQLWSVRTGAEVEIARMPLKTLDLLLFSPDCRWLVIQRGVVMMGESNPVYFWDRAAKRFKYVLKSQNFWHSLHHFSPDGRMVAGVERVKSSPKRDLVLWDAASGGERLRLPGYGETIQCMAFSPCGGMLALGGEDGIIRLWDIATAKVRQSLRGDRGAIRSLAFSPDGKLLASVGENTSVLIWRINPIQRRNEEKKQLSRRDRESCWRALTQWDVAHAFTAQQLLATAPNAAREFIGRHLRPIAPVEPERVQRLIADLDSESFPRRERAMRQLEKWGDGTEGHLRQTLRHHPSLELRQRVERLLEGLSASSPRHRREGRMLEVLEWLNTAESRRLLTELAGGASDAWLTREAKAALRRCAGR